MFVLNKNREEAISSMYLKKSKGTRVFNMLKKLGTTKSTNRNMDIKYSDENNMQRNNKAQNVEKSSFPQEDNHVTKSDDENAQDNSLISNVNNNSNKNVIKTNDVVERPWLLRAGLYSKEI